MKLSTLSRLLAGTGLALGLVAGAHALPSFTINPLSIGPSLFGAATFTADAISISNSSELITLSNLQGFPGGTAAGSGYATFGTYSLNGTDVAPNNSGLLLDYNLYLTFNIALTRLTGGLGSPNSTYRVDTLDFSVFADPGKSTTFTQATNAGATGTPTMIGGNATDIFLAFGSLVFPGSASINALNGVGINAINDFGVCTANNMADVGGAIVIGGRALPCMNGIGDMYFDTPVPFYSLVFSTLSNTLNGVMVSGDGLHLAINAAGRVDFAAVPEPATLALVGFALVGLGISRRARKA